jgi:hypothetical protein
VGSEMCIRDRDIAGRWLAWLLEPTPVSPEAQPPLPEENPLWDASTC